MPRSDTTLLDALEAWYKEHGESLLADGIGSSFFRRRSKTTPAATIRFDWLHRRADLTIWTGGECVYSLADARSGGVGHRSVKIVSSGDLNSTLRVVISWLQGGPAPLRTGLIVNLAPAGVAQGWD
jgi:hypothetical protein